MNKPKTIITVLSVFFLVAGLGVGLYLVGQRQLFSKKAAPASEMYVSPASISKAPGDSFTFSVNVTTGTDANGKANVMNGFEVQMSFSPAVMEVSSLSLGSVVSGFSIQALNSFDNTTGKISFSNITTDSTKAVTGSGLEVLQVSAKVKPDAPAGNYNLTLEQTSLATDISESQDILISKNSGTLTVTGSTAGGSPSPSASPADTGGSPSPSASPAANASASPSSSPRVSPSPTSGGTTTGTTGTTSVKITSPVTNSTISDSTPTFKGTAAPGTTVTITIYSDPITATVTADASGNWQYTPTQALADGGHTVSITAKASDGTTKSATGTFTVQTSSVELPVTGTSWVTILTASFAVLVIISSFVLAL